MKKFKRKNGTIVTFFKNHKYIGVLLILILSIVFISFAVNYSSYAFNIIRVYYLRTQNFYFNSNKLTSDNKSYEISPWPGTSNQTIIITMNSLDNSLKGTHEDIEYQVSVTCDNESKVSCYLRKNEDDTGKHDVLNNTIPGSDASTSANTDSFNVVLEPKNGGRDLVVGDKISIKVTANATSPYTQKLEGTFVIIVGNYGINFEISDEAGRMYLDTLITNTLDDDSYVRLNFPINTLTFDMSNTIYNNCTKSSAITTGVDCAYRVQTVTNGSENYEYISGIDFKVNGKSSSLVRFFKDNISNINQDFTYKVGSDNSPIIDFCKLDTDSTTKITSTTVCETE